MSQFIGKICCFNLLFQLVVSICCFNSCFNLLVKFLVSQSRGKKCKSFYWFDPELNNQRYRETIYELYMTMNKEEREDFTCQRQMEEIATEFDLYKSNMNIELNFLQLELKKAQSNVWFYKKVVICILMLITMSFMLY